MWLSGRTLVMSLEDTGSNLARCLDNSKFCVLIDEYQDFTLNRISTISFNTALNPLIQSSHNFLFSVHIPYGLCCGMLVSILSCLKDLGFKSVLTSSLRCAMAFLSQTRIRKYLGTDDECFLLYPYPFIIQ